MIEVMVKSTDQRHGRVGCIFGQTPRRLVVVDKIDQENAAKGLVGEQITPAQLEQIRADKSLEIVMAPADAAAAIVKTLTTPEQVLQVVAECEKSLERLKPEPKADAPAEQPKAQQPSTRR